MSAKKKVPGTIFQAPFSIFCLADCFGEGGSYLPVIDKYGMSARRIAEKDLREKTKNNEKIAKSLFEGVEANTKSKGRLWFLGLAIYYLIIAI